MSLNFNSSIFTPSSNAVLHQIDGNNLKANLDRQNFNSGSTSLTATPTSTTFSSPANTSPSISPQVGKENGDPVYHGIPNFSFLNEPNNTWSSPSSIIRNEQELSNNLYGTTPFSTQPNPYKQPLDLFNDSTKRLGKDVSPSTYNNSNNNNINNFDFSQNLTNRANQLLVFPDIEQSLLAAKKYNPVDVAPKFAATNDSLLSSKSVPEGSNSFNMSIFNGFDSNYASRGNFPQYSHVNNRPPSFSSNSLVVDTVFKPHQHHFQSHGDLDSATMYNDFENVHSVSKQEVVLGTRPKSNGLIYTVQFKRAHRTFLLGSSLISPVNLGDFVKVEADRGEDLGIVSEISDISSVKSSSILNKLKNGVSSMKCILRLATPGESAQLKGKLSEEDNVIQCCRDRAVSYMLPMQVVDAEYQFDRHKLTIYYEANKRIDFRELVRDLFSVYKTRIWMEHITYSFRPHPGGSVALATGHASHFFNHDHKGLVSESRPFSTGQFQNTF